MHRRVWCTGEWPGADRPLPPVKASESGRCGLNALNKSWNPLLVAARTNRAAPGDETHVLEELKQQIHLHRVLGRIGLS